MKDLLVFVLLNIVLLIMFALAISQRDKLANKIEQLTDEITRLRILVSQQEIELSKYKKGG